MSVRRSSYGLQIETDIPLPGLDDGDASLPADVTVRVVPALGALPEAAVAFGDHVHLSEAHLRMVIPDVATFDVHDGSRIEVLLAGGADLATVRLYLLGTAVGTLLRQRGLLVLHGNAVRTGEGTCIVAVGHSGAGKSTLAAAFQAAGHDVLADDVVAVSGGLALPGLRRLKLWQDAVDRLGLTTGLLPLALQPGKSELTFDRPRLEPLVISCVYVLDDRGGEELALEPLRGMARYEPLATHTYRPELVTTDAERARELAAVADLASRTRVVRVRRPDDPGLLADTVSLLLADAAGMLAT